MNITSVLLFASISVLLTSCSRPEKLNVTPQEAPKSFSFTQTNAVVAASEIQSEDNDKRSLQGDFNLDGLNDLAIIRAEGEIRNQVDIYIQNKAAEKASGPGQGAAGITFFKGGTITRPSDGSIIGLASKTDNKMVDIIMLISFTNRPNEMIHYKNDGTSFTEVEF